MQKKEKFRFIASFNENSKLPTASVACTDNYIFVGESSFQGEISVWENLVCSTKPKKILLLAHNEEPMNFPVQKLELSQDASRLAVLRVNGSLDIYDVTSKDAMSKPIAFFQSKDPLRHCMTFFYGYPIIVVAGQSTGVALHSFRTGNLLATIPHFVSTIGSQKSNPASGTNANSETLQYLWDIFCLGVSPKTCAFIQNQEQASDLSKGPICRHVIDGHWIGVGTATGEVGAYFLPSQILKTLEENDSEPRILTVEEGISCIGFQAFSSNFRIVSVNWSSGLAEQQAAMSCPFCTEPAGPEKGNKFSLIAASEDGYIGEASLTIKKKAGEYKYVLESENAFKRTTVYSGGVRQFDAKICPNTSEDEMIFALVNQKEQTTSDDLVNQASQVPEAGKSAFEVVQVSIDTEDVFLSIGRHKDVVTSMSFSPSGQHLVTGSEDGSVHLYKQIEEAV